MRVATRRMRAAWRVFGDGYRPDRTRRYRKRLREVAGAARRGPRPRRPHRGGRAVPRGADRHRAARPRSRCSPPGVSQRDDARVLLARELDSDGYVRWVDEFKDFVRTEGSGHGLGPADRAAPRPGDGRLAHLGRLRAGPRLRTGPALGRRRDAPRAADHRQVAALHARVRAGVPRAGRRPRSSSGSSRCRTTSGSCTTPMSRRRWPVPSSSRVPAACRRPRRRRSAATSSTGRREVARLRRTVGPTWRAIVGVSFRRGLGGPSPLSEAGSVLDLGWRQPWAMPRQLGSATPRRACVAARTAPSRIPVSTTVTRSRP